MAAERFRVVFGSGYVQVASGRLVREGVRGIRYGVAELDLSKLGERAVMIVLTYPGGDWRRWCSDDGGLDRQIAAFLAAWRAKWGEPVGFWCKEFQQRGAPHVNLYVGWPEAAGGYAEVRHRTLWVKKRSAAVGERRARDEVAAVTGELGLWARTAWAKVVTGNNMTAVARAHHGHGVDMRVSWWTDRAHEFHDRAQVAWYIAREVGKEHQKAAPKGWGRVTPWWAPLGGLMPDRFEEEVSYIVWGRMRDRLLKYCVERKQRLPWDTWGGVT
ncbi:MAG TPA: hypothetical protein VME46_23070, partial [Acidimicrobiales bacterium]|nr:hypothetical protein [Acidimicrobiales bacterium]